MRNVYCLLFTLVTMANISIGQESSLEESVVVSKSNKADSDTTSQGVDEDSNSPGGEPADTEPCGDPICCAGPACHCIQELWLDFAGPFDVYVCLTHIDNCSDGVEEMWWGYPDEGTPPQQCTLANCEQYEGGFRGEVGFPGHDLSLSGIEAWALIEKHLLLAKRKNPSLSWNESQLRCHQIPNNRIPTALGIAGDIIVMAVPITVEDPDSPLNKKKYYFCLQVDSPEGIGLTPADMGVGKMRDGAGRQFAIDYVVADQDRKGLVWLKSPAQIETKSSSKEARSPTPDTAEPDGP